MALKAADIGYVMESGEIKIKGGGNDLLNNDSVREAYLGRAGNRKKQNSIFVYAQKIYINEIIKINICKIYREKHVFKNNVIIMSLRELINN